ncbi:imelysin family protein [Pseudoalteromonas luteoviolacea]|uniref:imelysin family protein n=1 Tax=Pseudoalteromonas luteoviolacea TaxID=43657 RepID=UPI0012DADFAE|nr:imelysin family protein [Pseudoalteromonas luteoviolacea]
MKIKPITFAIFSALALVSLSGCGGSGGDSSTPAADTGNNDTSGSDTSGGDTSGGDTSGGDTSGGDTSGGDTSGGDAVTPGEMTISEGQSKVLAGVSDSVITPIYKEFLDSTVTLLNVTNSFCEITEPAQSDLKTVQEAWKSANNKWQFIRATKFGPLAENFTYSRIQLWPFLPNRTVSSVESALETNYDFSSGFNDTIHQRQGLPAFEYLVFNQDDGKSFLMAEDRAKRCDYLKAIASNVNGLMSQINTTWINAYSQQFKAGNGEFESQKDALETLFKYWFEYLEVIADDKLKEPLGVTAPGKPEEQESYWAEVNFENIRENITSLKKLYDAGDQFGFDDYLIAVNNREDLKDELEEKFAAIFLALDAVEGKKLADLITQEEGRSQIVTLGQAITSLRTVMSTDFVQVTDIQPGFNTNDGD